MKTYLSHKVLSISCLLFSLTAISQNLPNLTPQIPQTNHLKPVTPSNSPAYSSPIIPHNPNLSKTQQQISQYERDRQEVVLREQSLKQFEKDTELSNIRYTLPSFTDPATQHFYKAFAELKKMDADSFSIKRATFIIENAYYNNTKSYDEFSQLITNAGEFNKESIRAQKLDQNNNLAKNLSIYQFITDTVTVNGKMHKPYTYDFNDYMGRKDWQNMFVHKLIFNGDGQCNSMPRLYQILAEQLNTESYLAFAPNHSFIKFKDYKGDWYNAELTSGALMADALMLSNGYIKAETVINGNYLTAQTDRQVMAQLLNDLASGYINKFGYDNYVIDVINKALELNPDGINSNIHRLNFLMQNMGYVAQQLQIKKSSELDRYPIAKAMYQDLKQQNKKLTSLGFEPIPQKHYKAWLKSLEKHKAVQDEKELLNSFKVKTNIKK